VSARPPRLNRGPGAAYRRAHCHRGPARCQLCQLHDQHRLTYAEINVLSLLLLGLSDERIAACLGNAPSTVKRQMTSLHDKTGTDDRLNLALWAIYRGFDWRSPRESSDEDKRLLLEREIAAARYQLELELSA
jgi:DNA-binding CsgD family transcriptional regulator